MRERWDNEKIEARLRESVARLGLERMPTASELRTMQGGDALVAQVTRKLGMDGWADRLGLPRAQHASRKGWRWEEWFAAECASRGLPVERPKQVKSPFDLLVAGLRIDVKCSEPCKLIHKKGPLLQASFNLHNITRPDAYGLVVLDGDAVRAVYIVPEQHAPSHMLVLSMGGRSKYERFRDGWDLFGSDPLTGRALP